MKQLVILKKIDETLDPSDSERLKKGSDAVYSKPKQRFNPVTQVTEHGDITDAEYIRQYERGYKQGWFYNK